MSLRKGQNRGEAWQVASRGPCKLSLVHMDIGSADMTVLLSTACISLSDFLIEKHLRLSSPKRFDWTATHFLPCKLNQTFHFTSRLVLYSKRSKKELKAAQLQLGNFRTWKTKIPVFTSRKLSMKVQGMVPKFSFTTTWWTVQTTSKCWDCSTLEPFNVGGINTV